MKLDVRLLERLLADALRYVEQHEGKLPDLNWLLSRELQLRRELFLSR